MNRLFGKPKEKVPPPNLTDCIANVIIKNCVPEFFFHWNVYE